MIKTKTKRTTSKNNTLTIPRADNDIEKLDISYMEIQMVQTLWEKQVGNFL